MESIDKLREWARGVTNSRPDENIVSPEFVAQECGRKALLIADEIEREIAERYMELPVDADGVPIRVGDEVTNIHHAGKFVVEAIGGGPKMHVVYFRNRDVLGFHYANQCRHVKPRTLEEVLAEYYDKRGWDEADNSALEADAITAKYADEIRELLRGDA